MAKARYRARKPPAPGAAAPRKSPWRKRAIIAGLLVGYAAVMWYVVFPYVDRTFVNQPAVGEDFVVPTPTVTASATP